MEISNKEFRGRAIRTSVFFIAVIVLSVMFFAMRGIDRIPAMSVINITADIFGMAMGFVLFVCCTIDVQKNGKSVNYLLMLIFVCFIALFTDEIAWLVDGIPSLTYANIAANTVYYITTPVLAYTYWRYVVTFMDLDREKIKIWAKGLAVGLVIAVAMRIINIFTGVYFIVDSNGVYHRVNLYQMSFIYAYVILVGTLVIIVIERKRLQLYQIISLFAYVMLPLLIGLITMFSYGLSLSSPVLMLVCLLMYCVLNVIQSRQQAVAESELMVASKIQENSLPSIFPPFPDRPEIDIYASMTPAKEVGGDFYDFFMIDRDHLAIVIADVSGKGIPAALFMMVAKTLIKNQTMMGTIDPGEIFEKVNDQLCEGNRAEMFVTAFLGILSLSTGTLSYCNAGHEYPALKRTDGVFEIIRERHFPPLATMEDLAYRSKELLLNPGDILFVYTDGVTEATNSHKELFGLERMLDALNKATVGVPEVIDVCVRQDIMAFVGDAEQFDDITMLSFKYNGNNLSS